ncbi:MAG: S41 family peptidase [Bacteroidales bacterium]|nr:S41 family peptidase [Bacteroidales bacterium]
MKKIFFFVLLALSYLGFSQTDVSWIRYPSISPDGKEIAFMYKGDIYKVSVDGGRAIQLTTHPAYNYNPKWSPDGKQIAFNSNRHGNQDVFIMPSEGGSPTRLTTNSANERLQGFSHDGKEVYFTANIQHPASYAQFPAGWATQLFKVSAQGGRSVLVLPNAMNNVVMSNDGKFLVYEGITGQENEWRKHQTSSVARDVWRYDFATGEFMPITDEKADSRNPVLSKDGKTTYFLSERAGSFNIWKFTADEEKRMVGVNAVTNYERHPVRFLSISDNETLCYTFDGKLYVLPKDGQPKQVKVDIFRDHENPITLQTLTTGATEATFSPNGKEVALIVRGDVYVTSVEFGTTKRITNTPGVERSLSWSPDGRSLAYAASRDGSWVVCVAKNMAKNEPYFFSSDNIVEEILVNDSKHEDFQPVFSPNGKEIAFLRDRTKIHAIDVNTKQIRQITDGSRNWSYADGDQSFAWSPDSEWLVLTFMGAIRHPYVDIGLVSAQGGEITNLTYSGYIENAPKFAMNGNVILFASDRFGMRSHASWGSQNDVFGIFTNQEALDRFKMSKEDIELDKERQKLIGGKKDTTSKSLEFELRHMENRIERLTIHSSNLGGFVLTPDGEKLFYLVNVEKGFDLWMRDFKANETRLVEKLGVQNASLEIDAKGEKLMVFAGGTVFTLDVKNTKTRKNVTYRAQVESDDYARRESMFNHVWRTVSEKFYRVDLHNVDWDGLYKDYEKFLPYINNYWDFSELLSEYLGELNASHTGSSFRGAFGTNVPTAKLGLLFDLTKPEKGIKIEEVIANGPFDNARTKVKAGHYLTKINGAEILENTDFFAMLNGQVGVETMLTFRDGNTEYTERIRPIANENSLLYNRWVQAQRDRVEKLSNGRLGYAHIQGMNDASYRTVYSEILGRYNDKEGVVIDVRFNGGGRLHEDVEVLLSGTKYLEQVPRGQKINDQPTKRWLKPSIMLQGEASYSNAHGTPWVYREMEIGKLVGMPVPGTMTSVWWENLPENGLVYGIPIAGYIDRNGEFLENVQLEPDVKVRNETNILWNNRDQQVEEAVKLLLQEADKFVDPWKNFEYNKQKK